uniref:Uncharacterized protein n=1 Tax=Ananas comosus var. bracteatus TaxID=296719 RepID=A0A6V7QER0_ANACO|nr:unnamed protein product [Ananas comosus var. bracteatus]
MDVTEKKWKLLRSLRRRRRAGAAERGSVSDVGAIVAAGVAADVFVPRHEGRAALPLPLLQQEVPQVAGAGRAPERAQEGAQRRLERPPLHAAAAANSAADADAMPMPMPPTAFPISSHSCWSVTAPPPPPPLPPPPPQLLSSSSSSHHGPGYAPRFAAHLPLLVTVSSSRAKSAAADPPAGRDEMVDLLNWQRGSHPPPYASPDEDQSELDLSLRL